MPGDPDLAEYGGMMDLRAIAVRTELDKPATTLEQAVQMGIETVDCAGVAERAGLSFRLVTAGSREVGSRASPSLPCSFYMLG